MTQGLSLNPPSVESARDGPQSNSRTKPNANGLSAAESRERILRDGYNEIPEKKRNPALKFLSYFWGPIPWMIEVAVILSGIVGHWADFGIILALLVVNAIVGFWEEWKADSAIAALKSTLALTARVKRDGAWTSLPARELVVDDVIRVRLGDIVPADATLLSGNPLSVDQAALTGESLPVDREVGQSVYAGSVIKQGEMDALVTATGLRTFFGKTAKLVESAKSVSHFQKAILKIGDFLIVFAVVLAVLIVGVALFRGDPFIETIQFALILTVAAIPVALPTVLSVTLAVGARLLSKSQAVVSRLAAIEELAGMDTLCSDKTGTLTQNKLTLGDVYAVDGISPEEVITCAALASKAEDQDPIDAAVLKGLKDPTCLQRFTVQDFKPFDPVHKRTEATVKAPDGKIFRVTKGAPQVVLTLVGDAAALKDAATQIINAFAAKGCRALGVARSEDDGATWKFLGILPLSDPPREDSKATIKAARDMGAQVKMITGDQVAIAVEIARQLDLGTNILNASTLDETHGALPAKIENMIENAEGFAQVYPEHKYHIVEILQKHGHIVGMTGDGVNDAPALKKADVGIAVSGATDAARAAADIVLLAPGLSVVVDAMRESRRIFQRMTHYAIYRIAETIRVLLFMTLSILIFNFYPVTAVMIVLLALLNDGAILSIAYDRVEPAKRPDRWHMPVILGVAGMLGIAGVVSSFGLFYVAERYLHVDRATVQSLIYLKLSVAGHLTVFVTRTRGPFWSVKPAAILFWAVVATQMIATVIAVYGIFMPPIGWQWAGLVWGYALAWMIVNDGVKLLAFRIFDPHAEPILSNARNLAR
jgi:H+-transporting ATPase